MRTAIGISFSICLVVLTGGTASATIDSVINTTIIYRHPQIEGYCYGQVPVAAVIGIPTAVQIDAALSPHYAFTNRTGPDTVLLGGARYVNLNEISFGAPIKQTYLLDSFSANGTFEYRAELDVTDLAAANGNTLEGRTRTVLQAKLALLAAARIAAGASQTGLFRLYLTFKGLPSQSGLPGTALPVATTKYPYSGGSPVLAALKKELISADCPASGGGKADALDDGPATVEESGAGCSTLAAGGPLPVTAGLGIALIGLVGLLAWRRRASHK